MGKCSIPKLCIAFISFLSVPPLSGQVLQSPELPPSIPARDVGLPPNLIARPDTVRTGYPDITAEDLSQPSWVEFHVNVVGVDARVEFWRHIPLDVNRLSGASLFTEDRLWYEVDAGSTAQCGWDDEPAERIQLRLRTDFSVVNDWSVKSHTEVTELSSPDKCLLTRLPYNATPTILKEAETRTNAMLPKVDELVKTRASFRKAAELLWLNLQTPVAQGGYVYLARPMAVATSNVLFDDTTKQIILPLMTIHAPTRIPDSSAATAQPLPLGSLLTPGDKTPFSVDGELLADFDHFVDASMDPTNGLPAHGFVQYRRRLTFDDLQMYAVDEQVGTRVDFHVAADRGTVTPIVDAVNLFRRIYEDIRYKIDKRRMPFRGTVYLTGQPSLNQDASTLLLKQLALTPQSLLTIRGYPRATWLEKSLFVETLDSSIRLTIHQQLETNRTGLSASGTQDIDTNFRLVSNCTSVRATNVQTVRQGLALKAIAEGEISVQHR